ncbi:putative glycosyltransferase [Cupriavidus phytorum]|uniref:Glycosyltransferase n=2 Tax=Cupriavidus TaxID=106589 RepID=A0A375BZ23_9BURK|nr:MULTISPECIES: glycosyltransferase family 2 protein [Cupriavidus]PZX29389.1 hypothetical protein C7416_104393 [Cupriavidus alkaliphilus]SOY58964.1 putative glycosyltransferase [Cupriavidus taiwanensis]
MHPSTTWTPRLTVSVVSHGQGRLLAPLLHQLRDASRQVRMQVIVTQNLPEPVIPVEESEDFRLTWIVNTGPIGFAENHNAAFTYCRAPFFCVMNPDVRLEPQSLLPLLDCAAQWPGVAGPRVLAPDGRVEDSARRVPSVIRLLRRTLKKRCEADYAVSQKIQQVDWLAGMCMVFHADIYRSVGGFDERFHLYCEDVDICLKIHLSGAYVSWVPNAVIIHDAQRASRRNWQYLRWHVGSLLRLFASGTYWRFRFFASGHDKRAMHV